VDVNHQLVLLGLGGGECGGSDADRVIGLHVPCPTAERLVALRAVELFLEIEMGGLMTLGFVAPDTFRYPRSVTLGKFTERLSACREAANSYRSSEAHDIIQFRL
jgi:hypothetical protein